MEGLATRQAHDRKENNRFATGRAAHSYPDDSEAIYILYDVIVYFMNLNN